MQRYVHYKLNPAAPNPFEPGTEIILGIYDERPNAGPLEGVEVLQSQGMAAVNMYANAIGAGRPVDLPKCPTGKGWHPFILNVGAFVAGAETVSGYCIVGGNARVGSDADFETVPFGTYRRHRSAASQTVM